MAVESQRVEDFKLTEEPYYLPLGNEVELFESAYNSRLPVMLKGPTGCGKTRFVEHMSWRLGRTLVIEFVPKDDSQVQRMLRTRDDIFPSYTREGFEAGFRSAFRIDQVQPVVGSERLLYLMTARGDGPPSG